MKESTAIDDDSCEIYLTNGRVAIVDRCDYEYLSKYKWNGTSRERGMYARAYIDGKNVLMHRLIMGDPEGLFIDHKHRDTLNNRRFNLRACTSSQNGYNSIGKYGKFKGVTFQNNKWRATVNVKGTRYHLGLFNTQAEAIKAYNERSALEHGEFAYINPEPVETLKKENTFQECKDYVARHEKDNNGKFYYSWRSFQNDQLSKNNPLVVIAKMHEVAELYASQYKTR